MAFAERVHTLKEPMPRDMGHYAVVAHEMLQGRHLYGDLFAQKPPLIYWIYCLGELIGGYTERSLFLISSLGASFVILCVYQLGKAFTNRRWVGLYAATIFTIICGDLYMHGSHPNPEVFMNGFLVIGLVYIFRAREPAHSRRDSVIASLSFFMAIMCKFNIVLVPAFLLGANILISRKSPEQFKRAVSTAITSSIVIFSGCTAITLYFFLRGNGNDFIYEMISFNRAYAGSLLGNLKSAFILEHLLPISLHFAVPLILVIILGIAASRGKQRYVNWLLFIAWVLGTFVSLALPGRYYYQYYQLWLPVLTIGVAFAINSLYISQWKHTRIAATVCTAAILIWTIRHESRFYKFTPNEWASNLNNSGDFRLRTNQFALNLNTVLRSDEVYFDASVDPEVYFLSKRDMPSGIHYADPTVSGYRANEYAQRLLNTLNSRPPELITVIPTYVINERIKLWILQNYERIPEADDRCPFNLWWRKNGRLAADVRQRIKNHTWNWKWFNVVQPNPIFNCLNHYVVYGFSEMAART